MTESTGPSVLFLRVPGAYPAGVDDSVRVAHLCLTGNRSHYAICWTVWKRSNQLCPQTMDSGRATEGDARRRLRDAQLTRSVHGVLVCLSDAFYACQTSARREESFLESTLGQPV